MRRQSRFSSRFCLVGQRGGGSLRLVLFSGLFGFLFLGAIACESSPSSPNIPDPPDESNEVTFTVLYTNDEHGWMEESAETEGAARLMGLWQSAEGYTSGGSVLVVSGGDNWTGPAISTWFQGRSMVDVMNAMGYGAAAVGNHEFDFGLPQLRDHAAASRFPFLSANIRYRSDNSTPTDQGIERFVIQEINGIQVGLIGLTTTRTPSTTKPDNVADFLFLDYETALREVVPEAVAAGAELIVVPGHVCKGELTALARQIADLGVDLLGGGHCNELFAETVGDILLLGGGSSLASYAVARIRFDTASDTVVAADLTFRNNIGGAPDPVVESVVRGWQALAEEALNVIIGYSDGGVARRSPKMQDLIVESWLQAYPTADVALTNFGGMRADLPPGEITIADVIGVMPFDNVIVELLLTGEQLEAVLRGREENTAIGGMARQSGRWVLDETGQPLEAGSVYSVLVNDFMYAGGDGYLFAEYDPFGYDTSLNWRQPVIDWITAQGSNPANPLDGALEDLGQ